jgi:hypothetical protein
VAGDAARDVDADGADLLFSDFACNSAVGPDAGAALDPAGKDSVAGAEADQGFFHAADVVDWAEAASVGIGQAAQVEDGVADELAGAVVGDVAAAVDLVDADAFAGEHFIGGEDVGAAGVAAQGEDGRVFEQQ